MTAKEFQENVMSMADFVDFCNRYGYYDWVDNYYTIDVMNEIIDDDLVNLADTMSWQRLHSYLDDLPTWGEWVERLYDGSWASLCDEDVSDIIQEAFETLQRDAFFEEEEEQEEPDEEEQSQTATENSMSLIEFFEACLQNVHA